ncbi:NUDIX hydrolase [Kocuria palustris]|uniref:NUDIX domain-containing protein n=1 Tax=Kocuria palustris TaxID=71999 RepID=UPI0011A2DE1A|nr:NUDIX hydrolase [Kocuria palustris]
MEFLELGEGELADRVDPRRVLSSETVYEGRIWNVVSDRFELSDDGPQMTRDYITHPGAVAVLALDEQDRILAIRQYRHPVGMTQWEIPAGILDLQGEHPADAALRELGEEADLTAGRLDTLVEFHNSPGSSAESLRIYLARDLGTLEQDFQREDEESEIVAAWVALDDAVTAVLDGRLHNPNLCTGVLAAHAARATGWAALRPADAAWPAHPGLRDSDGVTPATITPPDAR